MLAHTAGAVVMNAPTVIVDGVEQQNPYVRRGTDGTIIEVHCRAMAFRYNETGQPMVSDPDHDFRHGYLCLGRYGGQSKKSEGRFQAPALRRTCSHPSRGMGLLPRG